MSGTLCVLFFQFNENRNSRTYFTFTSKESAVEGVVKYYEELLRRQHGFSSKQAIKYHVNDVINFINSLEDVALLEKQESLAFAGRDRAWLIRQLPSFFSSL